MTSPVHGFAILPALCLLTIAAGAARAQAPFQVKDINPGGGSSSPTGLVTIGTTTFFAADNGTNGVELWKSDGTGGGTVLVKNICPGACSSNPENLIDVNGTLFFSADNGTTGHELWKSNGTAAGTVLLKDIWAGSDSSILSMVAVGSLAFLSANDGGSGIELWKSNGTTAGTARVKDLMPGVGSSAPTGLTAMGTTVYFAATTLTEGREIYKSNGTAAGTVLVKNLTPIGNSTPVELTAVGSTLFFSADTGGKGFELWKSDGTEAGTELVKDIRPGYMDSWPTDLTDVAGLLFFSADDGTAGREIWKSDGTEGGTVLVRDIAAGGSSSPTDLTAVDATLFFGADDGVMGNELWRSDGTFAGTFLARDINPGPPAWEPSDPNELIESNGTVFFAADDGMKGSELWQSDGTGQGTVLVGDLAPGAPSSSPSDPSGTPELLLFAAEGTGSGRELWALQVGGAVLELTKQFTDGAVLVGSSGHTFTLTVSNTGASEATDVRVTDLVDARLTVTNIFPAGACAASSGQSIDCSFPTLAAAANEVVIVTFSVNAAVVPVLDVLNEAQAVAVGTQPAEAADTIDLLAPCAPLPVDLDVLDKMIEADYLAEACRSISVGPEVMVTGSGDAAMRAGESIVLNSGFSVENGGVFTAVLDPTQSVE